MSFSQNEFLKRFGANMRRLRLKRGLSRKELARCSGLSTELISAVEQGRQDVHLGVIHRLVEALSLSARDEMNSEGRGH